ncbi:MAG: LEA type 2 family protein [Magnetococcales bacterium]|nr:LEA type 2 family protein [Magnetococcales bacterium]
MKVTTDHRLVIAAVLILASWLSACAIPKVGVQEKLDVELMAIEPEKIALSHQTFQIKLRVSNPNSDPLPISALKASISLEGNYFASVHLQKPMTVKAHGNTEVQVTANTTLLESSQELKKIIKNCSQKLNYHLDGAIRIDRPLIGDIPFKKSGQVDLGQKRGAAQGA